MAVFTTDLTCLFCSYMTPGSVCLSTCAPLCFHGVAVVALFLTWSSCCVAVVLGCAPPHTSLCCLSRWWCLCFITHFLALLSFSSSSSFFCFLAVWTSLPLLLFWILSLCLWDQGPFARLRTFWNSTHSMGWMGKRGALTSLLWKVTHLGLLFGVFCPSWLTVYPLCCASMFLIQSNRHTYISSQTSQQLWDHADV